MRRFVFAGLCLTPLLCSAPAQAHYPVLDCQAIDGEVKCEAGFSDRSKAPDVVMEVYSENDEVVSEGRTDAEAMYRFSRPDGLFFIIMDAGPGHVLEISSDEVSGI